MKEGRRKVWKNRQICSSWIILFAPGCSLPHFSIKNNCLIFKGQWSNQNAETRRSVECVEYMWPVIQTPNDRARCPWRRYFLASQLRLSEDSNRRNMLVFFQPHATSYYTKPVSGMFFFPNVDQIWFFLDIYMCKPPNTKFHRNPSSGGRNMSTDMWMDGQTWWS